MSRRGSKILVLLLPLFVAVLLFAAHVMRYHGLTWGLLVFLLVFSLLVRHSWVPKLWQFLVVVSLIEWTRTTVHLVRMRINLEMPYTRLLLIMAGVILFNVAVVYTLGNRKLRVYYSKKEDDLDASPNP